MPSSNKDTERGNDFTGVLEVKVILDTDNVVSIPTEYLRECYFIEDIFACSMVGRISFLDNFGMYELGPFTGNETVSIKYGRTESREVVFTITRVKKIVQGTSTSSYVSPYVIIDIADTTFEFFTMYRFSRSYEKNIKHTDAVKHIIKHQVGWDDDRQISIIPSISELDENFCTPYWPPKASIDWLLSNAYNKNDGGYICYSNTYHRHTVNVKPLTWLLSKYNVLDEQPYQLETKGSGDPEDPTSLRNKILEWWIDGIDHTKTKSLRNSKFYGFNIEDKKMHELDFDYNNGIKYTPVLGNYTLFEDKYNTSDTLYSNINMSSGQETIHTLRKFAINDFVKNYCLHQLLNVMVIGNEKKYAGHQIYVNWSSTDQKSKTKNRLFDGPYLVKTITHDFITGGPLGYIQRMVLIKNGFQNPNTRLLKKSINININGGVKTPAFKEKP